MALPERLAYVQEDRISRRLVCAVCLEPLVEPRRTPCKHTFCQACISPLVACPTCRTAVSVGQLQVADQTLLELLGELIVLCRNHASGCDWQGPRENLAEHTNRTCRSHVCANSSSGCKWSGLWSERPTHETICTFATVQCRFATLKCAWRGLRCTTRSVRMCPVCVLCVWCVYVVCASPDAR